jgi:hypothetical protein
MTRIVQIIADIIRVNHKSLRYLRAVFLCLLFSFSVFSQNTDTTSITNDSTQVIPKDMKGFHIGLQAGTLFANKYTTNLYNGYGFDPYGNQNNFTNSFLNQTILLYGGAYGGTDRIAQALGVAPGAWSFNPQDMPVNLKYNVAIQVGLNTRYCFDNKNAIIYNLNVTKLTVSGDFNIETTPPVNSNGFQGATNYNTFSIVGGEERLINQLGFQRILGDNPLLNFFVEGGVDMTLAKYLRNQITINGLIADIGSPYYSQPAYGHFRGHGLLGVGFGAFAGIGLNLTLSSKYIIQLLYNPSYDKINVGESPKLTFQQSIGFRAYYNF